VVRIEGDSINRKLISEIFLVRCGSKGCAEVRPEFKNFTLHARNGVAKND